jgi:hypothetical protein
MVVFSGCSVSAASPLWWCFGLGWFVLFVIVLVWWLLVGGWLWFCWVVGFVGGFGLFVVLCCWLCWFGFVLFVVFVVCGVCMFSVWFESRLVVGVFVVFWSGIRV